MRGVINESRVAVEAVLERAQGVDEVGVGRRLRGIPISVGREAATE